MRRRLDIASSIVVTRDLLFLDEPTTGLDPRSRSQVWEIVRVLVAEGATVLLSTQYLDEADQLADRLAIIDHGRVIAEGTRSALKATVGAGTLHVRVGELHARTEAQRVLRGALGALVQAGIAVAEFALGQPSLDEVFLTLTGHSAETDPNEAAAA